jgi:predicted nucleic acid-binding protein
MIVSVDTNVFVYAADDDEPDKQKIARDALARLATRGAPVGLQVIGELQNALRRGLGMPNHLASQQARNIFTAFGSFPYDAACVDQALAQSAAGRLSYWDALLLSACDRAGIQALLSEDMQDGFVLGRVEVINPFGPLGLTDRARAVLES